MTSAIWQQSIQQLYIIQSSIFLILDYDPDHLILNHYVYCINSTAYVLLYLLNFRCYYFDQHFLIVTAQNIRNMSVKHRNSDFVFQIILYFTLWHNFKKEGIWGCCSQLPCKGVWVWGHIAGGKEIEKKKTFWCEMVYSDGCFGYKLGVLQLSLHAGLCFQRYFYLFEMRLKREVGREDIPLHPWSHPYFVPWLHPIKIVNKRIVYSTRLLWTSKFCMQSTLTQCYVQIMSLSSGFSWRPIPLSGTISPQFLFFLNFVCFMT